jgi:ABC-type methionine transport system ATPase subunit
MDEMCVNVRCCDLVVCVGSARIIDRVTFDCCQGEWVVITGPSGAGKSTLLRAINGLCPPSAGRIWALGSWIPGRPRREAQQVWRRTGTVLQELALFETKTAAVNVELGLRAAGHDHRVARRQAITWLERFGLEDKTNAYPAHLSGGEKQRVAIARALAPQPQLLILDEPTSHLDNGSARIVLTAIKELVEEGATVVMSSHRLEEIASLRSCHIVLERGRVSSACR